MSLLIAYNAATGGTYAATIVRLSDGHFWTPGSSAFTAAPAYSAKKVALTEGASENVGSYTATVTGLGDVGECFVRIHDEGASNATVEGQSVFVGAPATIDANMVQAAGETVIATGPVDLDDLATAAGKPGTTEIRDEIDAALLVERPLVVAAIEVEFANDLTGEALKQAFIDRMLENLPDLDDLTLAAIQTAAQAGAEAAGVDTLLALLQADQYVDTSVTPWELVYIEAGTGAIGVGTELMRKALHDVTGADLVSTATIVGQQVEA